MKKKGLIYLIIVLAVIVLMGVPARRWSREHVNYITAAEDHPLNCFSCHLYTQKDNFLARLVNTTYLSPFNLTVSPDGGKLYIVAQEGDVLLVVDSRSDQVLGKIPVGKHPHSVVLNSAGNSAFVSNQWEDNIYEIDLNSLNVVDTLKTGSGPAGMVLSKNEKLLYVVNSFGNEVSIFDLDSKTEKKRLMTGNNPTGAAISPAGDLVYITSRRVLQRPARTPVKTEMTVIDAKRQRVKERKMFEHAYIMENVEFTSAG
ncbi:MAG: YncE family protein, partial [Bacteroidales bacterium]|nr:YncE family protein [Bacteroidales bacterium]